MLKMIGLLHRRPGLSPQEFQRYWREHHSHLGRVLPGLRRYVQNHTRLSGYRGRQPVYDGVAELWFDDEAAFLQAMRSPELRAAREDEPNFLDVSRVAMIVARDHVVLDAPAPEDAVKLISFLTRRSDLDPAAFQVHWREKHGPIAATIPGMRRYVQSHTDRQAFPAGPPPPHDGVPLAWFDDTAALRASEQSQAYRDTRADEANFLEPGRLSFVIATEHEVALP